MANGSGGFYHPSGCIAAASSLLIDRMVEQGIVLDPDFIGRANRSTAMLAAETENVKLLSSSGHTFRQVCVVVAWVT